MGLLVAVGATALYVLLGLGFERRRARRLSNRAPCGIERWFSKNMESLVVKGIRSAMSVELGIDEDQIYPTDTFESLRLPQLFDYDTYDSFAERLADTLAIAEHRLPPLTGRLEDYAIRVSEELRRGSSASGFPVLIDETVHPCKSPENG